MDDGWRRCCRGALMYMGMVGDGVVEEMERVDGAKRKTEGA